MSDDAQKNLTVGVKIVSDGSGATQATNDLNKVNAAANNAADGTKNLSDATKEGGESAKPFAHEMREVRKVTRELGHEFPLAALALKAFLNPVGAAIGIAIGFFVKMKESIDEVNKSLDEAGAKAAEPTFKEAIDAKREALEQAKLAAEAWADKMEHAGDETDHVARELKLATEAAKQYEETVSKAADFKKSVDEHLLELQWHRGLISAETYYTRLAELEKKAASDKAAREKQSIKDEIGRKGSEVLARTADAVTLEPAAEAANKAAAVAHVKTAGKQAELKSFEERQKDLDQSVKDKLGEIDKNVLFDGFGGESALRERVGRLKGIPRSSLTPSSQRELDTLTSYDAARTAQDQGQKAIDNLRRNKIPESESAEGHANRDRDRADAKAEANRTALENAQRDLEDLNKLAPGKVNEIDQEKTREKFKTAEGQQVGKSKFTGEDIVLAAQESKIPWNKITDQQKAHLESVREFAKSFDTFTNATVNNFSILSSTTTTLAQKLAALEREMKQVNDRQRNSGVNFGTGN